MNFPNNTHSLSLNEIHDLIQKIMKTNHLKIEDFVAPAFNYYEKNHTLKPTQALLFNLDTTESQNMSFKISEFFAQKNNIEGIEKLITSHTISISEAIQGSIMAKNTHLTNFLFEKDYFLSQKDLNDIYLKALMFNGIKSLDLVDEIYQKKKYKKIVEYKDDFIAEISLVQTCFQGKHIENLYHVIQKNKLKFKYVNSFGANDLIIENVLNDEFMQTPFSTQTTTLTELNKFFNDYSHSIIEIYLKKFMQTQYTVKDLMPVFDFYLESKWVENAEFKDILESVKYDRDEIDVMFTSYENVYKIEKEKNALEKAISASKIGSKLKI
jgi:ASC-1-like (ASCH) protein